ncbi:SIR2 family protein [Hirschia litorea]|uniref:SIR2 family protein n=1 Tax=Hirschia litorea TaxID=1199156 RepID=A0ABW2IJ73_9PROT
MGIEDYVASTKFGIDNLSFLFGAGTSFEAGYPLISGLTVSVLGGLSPDENNNLSEVFTALKIDVNTLNIEEISDCVLKHYIESQDIRFFYLMDRIRSLISEVILDVSNPNLSNHISFFNSLKRRAFNRSTVVWIFTTNYDLLFEEAAALSGVNLINGFTGVSTRFYSEDEFHAVRGTRSGSRFVETPALTVRLVKLHGSVSWYKNETNVFECHPQQIPHDKPRCMVLPRRKKVIETLDTPYQRLFRISSEFLGSQCVNLIASGFSFCDDHINDTLITSKINNGKIILANFCEVEPPELTDLRSRPNVSHITKDKLINGGIETAGATDFWKFSEFVKLF